MATRSWIRRLFDRKPRTLRTAPARRRPALESLEDRTLLSLTPTALDLGASSQALTYGQSETLTAVITTPNGDPTPTSSDGTVSFYAGATLLGSAPLSVNPATPPTATATLITKALPGGTDNVTARYSGDGSFAASTTAVSPQSGVSLLAAGLFPYGVAVDSAGDTFVTDTVLNQVFEFKPGSTTPITIASGLSDPKGVAVDAAGDVFIADTGNNQVLEVKPGAAPTSFVTGLSGPRGLAADGAGNLYIADTGDNQVLKVTPDGSHQSTVGANLSGPTDVAVDGQGDVFIADAGNQQVVEVPAAGGGQSAVISGVTGLGAVAVDAEGDLFLTTDLFQTITPAGSISTPVLELTADGNQNLLGQGIFQLPSGLAVDGQGDVFVADPADLDFTSDAVGDVREINAGVPVTVSPAATTLALSAASSTVFNGQGATFTATLTSATGAVPGAGDGSVTFYNGATVLGSAPLSAQGTATYTTAALPVGTSLSVTATYSGDTNFQSSRFGAQMANPQVTLPGFVNFEPIAVAVDARGDVFAADPSKEFLEEVEAGSTQPTVFGSGLGVPSGVAVDVQSDVFVAETGNGDVLEFTPGSTTPITVASGLDRPGGVAVDGQGDVFIANTGANQVLEVTPGGTTSTWGTGLLQPQGVAVDGQGDVFIADTGNDRVVEVTPSGTQTTLGPAIIFGSPWLKAPTGVAVDGSGDVFIADQGNNRVVELEADGVRATVGSGLSFAQGVALDGAGDLYIADTSNSRAVEVTPSVGVTVGPAPTALTLSVTGTALIYGQSETLTATVTVPKGAALPGGSDGTVTFYDNGKALGTEALSSSATAGLTLPTLAPGEHNFTARYTGDSAFLPSNTTVQPQSAEGVPFSAYSVGNVFYTAADGQGGVYVADSFVRYILPDQVIHEKADGTQSTVYSGAVLGLAVDSAGDLFIAGGASVMELTPSGKLSQVLSGPFQPNALAVDDTGDLFISDRRNSRVLELTPSGTLSTVATFANTFQPTSLAVDGQGDLFIARLAFSGDQSDPVLEVKPDGSQTTFASGLGLIQGLAADGQGDVLVLHAPDTNSTSSAVLEVKPDGSQTSLPQLNPAFVGLSSSALAEDGQGDLLLPQLTSDGNNIYITPLIAGVPVSVTVPTAISVSASSTAPLYGQSVTFTATVTVPAGDPVPTSADGTVTLYDGSTVLGTATFSGSTATPSGGTATYTLTTAALAPGLHEIGASYSGDSGFTAASTQATVGSGLVSPTGVAVDSAGDVFIADTRNDRVVEVKPDGSQTTVASGLEDPFGVGPEGVAVDGQGDLFITLGISQVVEVKPGGTPTTVASGFHGVVGVAVDSAGDVFIADSGWAAQLPGQVVEVKPDGTRATIGSGLLHPSGVAVDGQGDVFIADTGNTRVVEVKPDGTRTTLGFGLSDPPGVAVDSQGDVFVADDPITFTATGGIIFGGRVLKLTPLAVTVRVPTALSVSASSATAYGQDLTLTATLTVPAGDPAPTAAGGSISFYDGTTLLGTTPLSAGTGTAALTTTALTAGTHSITAVYSGDSSFTASRSGVQTVVPATGLRFPAGVAVDNHGDVFIADSDNKRVVELKPDGTLATVASGLSTPLAVAVDGQGDVFIADLGVTGQGDGNVVEVQAGSSAPITVASGLTVPDGVAVDSAGDVFIAQNNNAAGVLEVKPDGSQTTIGSFPGGATGVAVDGAGDLFLDLPVVGLATQVVELKPDGTQVPLLSGLSSGQGVAVDGAGDVFAAEAGNNRVLERLPDGTQVPVGSGLDVPFGVAADGAGDVYIADTFNDRVVEVTGVPVSIGPATPTVTVSDAGGTYNGKAFAASASVSGVVAGVDSTPAATLEGVAPALTYYPGTYATLAALNTAIAGGLTGAGTAPTQAGSYTVLASFAGSTDYGSGQASATFAIGPAATTTSAVTPSAATAVYGQPLTLTATVSNKQTAATPAGTVAFYYGTTELGAAPVGAGGVATLTVATLPVGKHSFTAAFSDPAADFAPSASPSAVSVTVVKDGTTTALATSATTPVFGQAVTLTATVAPVAPGTATPTGVVTFKDGTTVLATVSLSGGSASFTTGKLAVGGHALTATFAGSGNFGASGPAAAPVTVSPDATAAAVTCSVAAPVYGQAVTLKATVTAAAPGSGKPTGTVRFYDGTTLLGSATLSSGMASLATRALAVGANAVTAVYGGDGNFTGTTSAALAVTVGRDFSTTKLASSLATAAHGTPVTFTATVLAASPGSGTPTGTVSFWDGATLLQTVNLSGGVAQLTYSFATAGKHKITAVYNGDADFVGGTSAVLTETIT